MKGRKFDYRGTRDGIDPVSDARRNTEHSSAPAYRAAAVCLAVALTAFAIQPSEAAEPDLVKIAVFDFELKDTSAGAGIIGQDTSDDEHLRESTDEARRMLSASGHYSVVDTSGAAGDVISAGGIQYCNGCDGPLARKLGADRSMIGVFTRVSRTEYSLQVLVRDARTGAVVSNDITGLRMGANDSWPRGVKWLMNNRILSAQRAE
jgi:fructose-1-phosphate kinase PfkB-like protein